MEKLRLNLDDLVVESFETVARSADLAPGTVRGQSGDDGCNTNEECPTITCNGPVFNCNTVHSCEVGGCSVDGCTNEELCTFTCTEHNGCTVGEQCYYQTDGMICSVSGCPDTHASCYSDCSCEFTCGCETH